MTDGNTLDHDTDAVSEPVDGPVDESVDESGEEHVEEPKPIWAEAARTVLLEVAGKYNAVITSKDLAAEVQGRTGVKTTQAPHYWMGDVLALVADECVELGEPLLPSLVVNAQGAVVPSYAQIVLATSGESPADADDHAARERLACHQRHDAAGLPESGGRAQLTPRLAASRTRERKNALAERILPVCPKCNHVLASMGTCDNCD